MTRPPSSTTRGAVESTSTILNNNINNRSENSNRASASTSSLQTLRVSNDGTSNRNNNGIGLAQELAEAIVHRVEGGDRAGRMVLILDDYYYSIQVKRQRHHVEKFKFKLSGKSNMNKSDFFFFNVSFFILSRVCRFLCLFVAACV